MHLSQVNTPFKIDIGAPMPHILTNELAVYLIFYARIPNPDWDGKSVKIRSTKDTGIISLKFNLFQQYKFGAPNDEAIEGHPYYSLGLQPYAFQQIHQSNWIANLCKMNAVHSNHQDSLFEKLKHYVLFFHDSCFEIVCRNYEILADTKPSMQEEIKRIATIL